MIIKVKEFLDTHDCTKRALKTFVQTFAGVLITSVGSGQYDIAEWKTWGATVVASALSAGISAVMNMNKKG